MAVSEVVGVRELARRFGGDHEDIRIGREQQRSNAVCRAYRYPVHGGIRSPQVLGRPLPAELVVEEAPHARADQAELVLT
jgi:hypothetical protein